MLLTRLASARTTASNDDLSKPGSELRKRHISRLGVMKEASDEIERLRYANELLKKHATEMREDFKKISDRASMHCPVDNSSVK